jgi:hypothetical protein
MKIHKNPFKIPSSCHLLTAPKTGTLRCAGPGISDELRAENFQFMGLLSFDLGAEIWAMGIDPRLKTMTKSTPKVP